MNSTPLIELRQVGKRYGSAQAVRDVNLQIDRGEFVAIMGPSGCGKTTTLRMLAGLEVPSEGEILLDGRRINELPAWQRNTPLVWQSLALFPFLNVVENVEFGLKMRGVSSSERRRKSQDWIERLGLSSYATRNVADLSGGQRQRVALARSLITEPPVLLLDEPLSALDAHLSLKMQGELKRLQRELGIAFIYVTHNHSEAFAMADRVVIMGDGQIQQIDAPLQVFNRPASRFVAEFLGGNNIFSTRVVACQDGKVVIRSSEGDFHAMLPPQINVHLGDKLDMVVRADRISLTPQSGWATNEVACSFVSEEFVGSVINGYLETGDGNRIVIQLQAKDLESIDLEVGRKFYASWHPEDCHLMQHLSTSKETVHH
ncbi:ABC transporter ATP-binding protein [Hydrogenophaga sp. Root209]|uniref:ABC transporter ATP-binding protein n=1 Tax=unclassified Hydrogenophaga TaxID=2610897 RepID=UPI0006F28B15|nr:ABC transporter ATP-binding protein [Hydrogenophaga sp. Root209]KRC12119.1 ABC transporter ATP-binding protein [Hydrogenophaga sp. Root209]